MEKVRVGVLGAYRGSSMINYCKKADNAELVAICDKWVPALDRQREVLGDRVAYYTEFEEFLQHDMDAVILANYANEHAPFAIRCLKAGKHVFSEVLPSQNMAEAVALVEAVEESGLIWAYGENFCFMPAPYEMRRLYREGKIGEFEYGECEYLHNLEDVWHSVTYGQREHWRNYIHANFYCTHSLGPMIHITGLRPVRVTGYEGKRNERNLRVGRRSGQFGMELVELENGGIIKSIHGGLYKNSVYYCAYGSKGSMESAREITEQGGMHRLFVDADPYAGAYHEPGEVENYEPQLSHAEVSKIFGHGGGDFYSMYYFFQKILGDETADIIDIYEAMDMSLPGQFAYRSVLAGGIPMDIPNMRIPAEREPWRGDTACTDPNAAGEMLWPSFSLGVPEIPEEVYDLMKKRFAAEFEANTGYVNAAFTQSGENSVEAREARAHIMMGR